jgi:AcrR family transcriptional regulator
VPAGRRTGQSTTRAHILASARREFAEKGYERASLRAIARGADVDQRLVTHFFGSKHGVFLAAMALPVDPASVVAEVATPGLRGMGKRLARRWVTMWDSAEGRHLVGVLRAAVSNERAARMMREVFVHLVLRQLVHTLEIDEPDRRASLVASQLFGLVLVRYVLHLEPVASMSPDEIAEWIGPTIQHYLDAGTSTRRARSTIQVGPAAARRARPHHASCTPSVAWSSNGVPNCVNRQVPPTDDAFDGNI